jgi:hypothetical protein
MHCVTSSTFHYKKSAILWRPKALNKWENPSQSENLLTTLWRPNFVSK